MNTLSSGAEGLALSGYATRAGQASSASAERSPADVKQANTQTQNSQAQQQQAQQQASRPLEREQLEKLAEQLQDFMGEMNRSLQFVVDQDSGRDVIKVLDKNSGDVIKQYPSEEVLSLVSKLSENAGLLIDHTV
jgi:flagellar protein FlaG